MSDPIDDLLGKLAKKEKEDQEEKETQKTPTTPPVPRKSPPKPSRKPRPTESSDEMVRVTEVEREMVRNAWIILYYSNFGRLRSGGSTGIMGQMESLKTFIEKKILHEPDINYKSEYNKLKKRRFS